MASIQAILFDKKYWSIDDSIKWVYKHGFKPTKLPHETKNRIRFRLRDPNIFNRLRTKKLGDGIEFIFGFY
jgi:hypothetical protein